MPTTLRLPGQPVADDLRDLDSVRSLLEVEVLRTHEVIGVVRGAALTSAELKDVNDDDVVELQFDGGVSQWITVAQLREEGRATRSAGGDVFEVPVSYRRGGAERGVWDWVLRGLRVLRIDPEDKLADLAETEVVELFEGHQQPPQALYRVGDAGALTETIRDTSQLGAGAAPWLVFIHGTASSTDGSFGKLFDKPEWQQLRARYGDHVLALQHKTLSVSPTANALDLASLLPAKAVLHLVTHSRGGLVGELLCLGNFNDDALRSFEGRAKDVAQLQALRTLVQQKQLTVEKFVRVACPARGTILASRRLDVYFSVLLNLLGRLMPDNPVYAILKATALELIKRRTDPNELPGLEAMMPESPYVHFLNKGLASQADLGVIAGDLQGDSFFTRLKAFATDIFFLEEHDLVVNTSSMFGGMGRPKGAFGFYDQGAAVNHFSYFENAKTRARLYGWLTAPKGERDPAFKPFDPRFGGIPIDPTRAGRKLDAKKPVVVIVPDVFGTVLRRGDEDLWPNVAAIARNGLEALSQAADVTVGPLIDRIYGPLVNGLSAANEVIPFPYDWRLSLGDSAAKLDDLVGGLGKRTVHLVAHGTGGLVVRLWQAQHAQTWKRNAEAHSRMLFLGTPLRGMFAAVQWMSGRSKLARMLALADGFASPLAGGSGVAERAGTWFCSLPGIVQLVPDAFLDAKAWGALGVAPEKVVLDDARTLRAAMNAADTGHVIAVVGRDAATPVAFADDRRQVRITANGDGRVAFDDAVPPGSAAWRVEAAHGEMTTHAGAYGAYAELLREGETTELRRPQGLSSTLGVADSDATEPLLFPTTEDLAIEAFRLNRTRGPAKDYPITVSVTHGDLRMVRYPVAVGHYLGDSIVSAEAVLDRQLDRRLSRRFQMGLYPAEAGKVDIIRAPKSSPPGAIIIGLGQMGSVNPEVIRHGIATAALRYALAVAEDVDANDPAATWRSAAFSAVLIGTNGGNPISIDESIDATIHGAVDANRTLRRQKQDSVRIDAIEFVELYEQRATSAVYAARRVEQRLRVDLEDGERIDVIPILRSTPSGQFRTPPEAAQTGWWQRIFITAATKGESGAPATPEVTPSARSTDVPLKYVVVTERARAEAMLQCRERNVTRMLVERAVKTPTFDAGVSGALFELLLPNEIKRAAAAVPSVVLTLDRDAAQIPWEILSDRTSADMKPYSVRAGLLRQFETPTYRVDPRAAELRTALVVGDTTSGYGELRGAQAEAEAVGRLVSESGFDVTALRRPEPMAFLTELFARPYRILHLAGHGSYNADQPAESGMVLDAKQGIYLTPCQLRQMRNVPDLVFINCCFLGTIDREPRPHLFAASVAEELIQMGVKAVVAAGWAVDDGAAVTFASTFYDRMLREKLPFGDAVRTARQEVFAKHPSTNTWAAYQCYGNPGFMLADVGGGAPPAEKQEFCTKHEYVDAIRSLEAQATTAQDREYVRTALETIRARIPFLWCDGELLAQLGFAWQAVGDYEPAVRALDEAVHHPSATAPIRAAEQLFNMLCRLAAGQAGTSGAKRDEVNALITEARTLKQSLSLLGSSDERLALDASMSKKLAGIATDLEESTRLLRESAAAYRESASLLRTAGKSPQYPLLNYVLIEWLLEPAAAPALLEGVDEIGGAVGAAAGGDSFWDRVGPADLELTRALLKKELDSAVDSVVALYTTAAQKGHAGTETLSVLEHVSWIHGELARRGHDNEAVAVEKLRTRLEAEFRQPDAGPSGP